MTKSHDSRPGPFYTDGVQGVLAGAAIILLGLSGQVPLAQQAAPAAASVAGRLTSPDGRPVRNAQVKISSDAPSMTRTTTTDADGRYAFPDLPADDYTLSASKPGYLEMVYGARRPGATAPGTLIQLAAGQTLDLSLRMPRGGVISGIITDEFGDPAFNVPVRAIRLAFSGGVRVAQPSGTATTDDLGAYRIAGLAPGQYLVVAQPRDTVAAAAASAESLRLRQSQIVGEARARGEQAILAAMEESRRLGTAQMPRRIGYVPVYYPAAALPSAAAPVTMGISDHVAGIDIQLQVLETAVVSGTVLNADGAPRAGTGVQLIDPAVPIANVGVWFRTTTAGGKFSFHGVVPGSYVVRSSATVPSGGASPAVLTGAAAVAVDAAAATDVTVTLRRGVTVSGSLDLETLTAPVDLRRVHVDLLALPDASDWEVPLMRASPDAAGKFAIAGVAPGRYRVAIRGLPSGWSLATAVFHARDAADYYLHVEPGRTYADGVLTFTNRTSRLAGVVTTASGEPVADRMVMLFPADRDLWVPQSRRIRLVQPGADGRFAMPGLPPGDYRLVAVDGPEPDQQFDPDYLTRALPASIAVRLAEGEQRTQDLRLR